MRTTAAIILGGLALTLAGCGQGGGGVSDAKLSASDPAVKALLADLPAEYQSADIAHGRELFGQCRTCHTVVKDGPNMTGPNLYGVFGRKAGTAAGYTYSVGLKGYGATWDAAALDKWIADPRAVVPNTKMSFVGLKDAAARRDVIAYLKVASSGGPT